MLVHLFVLGERADSQGDDSEIVCEGGVCYKRPKQPAEATSTEVPSENDSLPDQPNSPNSEEKLRRAKELIEKKKKEKDEEDARVKLFSGEKEEILFGSH